MLRVAPLDRCFLGRKRDTGQNNQYMSYEQPRKKTAYTLLRNDEEKYENKDE